MAQAQQSVPQTQQQQHMIIQGSQMSFIPRQPAPIQVPKNFMN